MPRSSYVENIEQRWLESGALYAGRYTPILQFSARDDKRTVNDNLARWSPRERDRYLDAGIFPKLNEGCCQLTGFDGYYVPLIIFLAVETGLRVQELCGLKWRDVSLDKRRMEVAKPRWPEEHEARTLVLSVRVRWYLERVALALQKDDRFDPLNPVIPMTVPAVHKALKDVANRAQVQIDGLLFDALHREAEARFDEAGLTKAEKDVMLGSALRILPGSQSDLASIQDKLDRHLLDGRTFAEAKNNIPLIPPDQIIRTREMMAKWGVLEIEEASPTVIRHFPYVVLDNLAP